MNKNGGINLPGLKTLEQLGKQERLQEQKDFTMTREEEAQELLNTVKVRLAPSPIHGIGVFAIRDIAKGEPLYCGLTTRPKWYRLGLSDLSKTFDRVYPEIKQLILDRWPQLINGAPFLSPNYDQRLTSFMNHSDTPNYDPTTDLALRAIAKGDEITEDYRVIPQYELAYPWLAKKVVKLSQRT